ncbi:MAG: hypothetical protein IJR93_12945 [Treponema sp.]|nr:hypothetical protein [Treponema sp.]
MDGAGNGCVIGAVTGLIAGTTKAAVTYTYDKYHYVLDAVKGTGRAPDGYVGGRFFQNREGRLPQFDSFGKSITYREWDVTPKIEGVNRGAERLITGSDGSAWGTSDHYRSFWQIE